ncbi:hypothetical protein O3P69_006937 [Scylla paramamosain]|uniref:Ig-like domain-containing protein n=1 Tax=Scylla paramamosain TaxID=85552 RepID=A0AAW0U314_SCYPA
MRVVGVPGSRERFQGRQMKSDVSWASLESTTPLTLDAITTTTTTPTTTEVATTFDTTISTTTPLQEDDWLHVLTDQEDDYDYDEDDYWLLNQTNCFPSDPSHDQSPKKDTIDFHDVRKQIVEHIVGGRELSDPEHLRLRALAAWRYQGRKWVVVNGGPLFLSPGLGAFDGVLQGGEANEDAVEWRRAANLTFPGGSAVVGGRSVLFDFVGREDAGTYICTARNPHGATYSTSVTIRVQYVPVVGVWGRTVGEEGVEIGCLGEGQPRPTLAWYKNNTKLPAVCDGNIEVKSTPLSPGFVLSVIKISNATVSDFAMYHCRAANSLGVSRSYLMLHDGSGAMSPEYLEEPEDPVIYSTPVENPRLASFLLGMVPPLYIALYIIAYLGCYKSPSTGGHGRFGGNVDMDTE